MNKVRMTKGHASGSAIRNTAGRPDHSVEQVRPAPPFAARQPQSFKGRSIEYHAFMSLLIDA